MKRGGIEPKTFPRVLFFVTFFQKKIKKPLYKIPKLW